MDVERPWLDPATGATMTEAEGLDRLGAARVVLLGEQHDRADHHRWQARVLDGLAARRARVVAGFEMFPRSAQPALDAWVSGGLGFDAFLAASRWAEVWGFDPALYRPLFDLCRARGLRMVALNVERPLVSLIGREGWEAIPAEDRGWFTPARPAPALHRRHLFALTGGVRPGRTAQSPDDPAFDRFVRAQQAWDRAFACALAEALAAEPDALVVGILGRGHLEHGFGTPRELADLGVEGVATALPDPGDPDADPDFPPAADLVWRDRMN